MSTSVAVSDTCCPSANNNMARARLANSAGVVCRRKQASNSCHCSRVTETAGNYVTQLRSIQNQQAPQTG